MSDDLYGVHVLHEDKDGYELAVTLYDDGTREHLIHTFAESSATTDELRAAFLKGLALCDRLDAAEGKTAEPDTEFVPADDALIGRVLAYGGRDRDSQTITGYDRTLHGTDIYTRGAGVFHRPGYRVEVLR
ncbi:MAG: hypothetical protein EKK62_15380 [Acidimicrobiia bacterium]|nr:MAG: hypothetical protein EKK62_15380 [Acidimicrobiia bacterium]